MCNSTVNKRVMGHYTHVLLIQYTVKKQRYIVSPTDRMIQMDVFSCFSYKKVLCYDCYSERYCNIMVGKFLSVIMYILRFQTIGVQGKNQVYKFKQCLWKHLGLAGTNTHLHMYCFVQIIMFCAQLCLINAKEMNANEILILLHP